MRRLKFTTWQLALLLVLLVTLTTTGTLLLCQAKSNKPHRELHETNSDYWNSIRIKPVKITSIDGNTFYWQFEDTHTVELGSFVIDELTEGKPVEGKTFVVIYCDSHKVAYQILPLH